jgi:hypothetical protein
VYLFCFEWSQKPRGCASARVPLQTPQSDAGAASRGHSGILRLVGWLWQAELGAASKETRQLVLEHRRSCAVQAMLSAAIVVSIAETSTNGQSIGQQNGIALTPDANAVASLSQAPSAALAITQTRMHSDFYTREELYLCIDL